MLAVRPGKAAMAMEGREIEMTRPKAGPPNLAQEWWLRGNDPSSRPQTFIYVHTLYLDSNSCLGLRAQTKFPGRSSATTG